MLKLRLVERLAVDCPLMSRMTANKLNVCSSIRGHSRNSGAKCTCNLANHTTVETLAFAGLICYEPP
jgi:hypothetical protein